jgi:hypothetical protein
MSDTAGKSHRDASRAFARRLLGDERGSVLGFVALALLALLGMLAVGVDLGLTYEARNAAQRTADAAALAGAAALVDFGNDPGVEDRVYEYAEPYVEENPVQGDVASMEPSDVVVDLENWRVTATVHRTEERGNPVATFFGRIIGIDEVDVAAVATAEAIEAGGVNCLLPLAIPDRWFDANDDGLFDPDDGDLYIPWPEKGWTGYTAGDIGETIVIKPFKKSGQMNESWYYPWRPPGQQGGDDYRENISSCVDPELVYGVGQEVDTEPGAMIGPTKQGFEDLIAQDPDAQWSSQKGCVIRDNPDICVDSPRIRPAPMFDPREAPDPGAKPFTFTNFANIFVSHIQANEVYGVFMGLSGVAPADPSGETTGAAFRFVRLIR